MIGPVEWTDVTSLEDLFARLEPGAAIKAGGIDLLDRLKEGLDAPGRLVNIRSMPGLDRIEDHPENGLEVGPLVTLAALSSHRVVAERYQALAAAAGQAATPQIRNSATVGGNLLQRPRCWYFRSRDFHCLKKGGDHCFAQDGENQYHAVMGNGTCAIVHPSAAACALLALGASLELTGPKGKRDLPIAEFFVTPETDVHRENVLADDELLSRIRVPAPAAQTRSAYVKLGQKESHDWPLAEAAVVLTVAGGVVSRAAVVLGHAAPVPIRSAAAEEVLLGRPATEASARAAAAAAVSGATPLRDNAYKVRLIEAALTRAVLAAGGRRNT